MYQLVNGPIYVIEIAHEDEPSRALANAGRRHALLKARIAQDAVLANLSGEVEVDLLVRAGLEAKAEAATLILVAEDDAILVALVHSSPRTRLDADRARTVVA
jgi:hypothetical protein